MRRSDIETIWACPRGEVIGSAGSSSSDGGSTSSLRPRLEARSASSASVAGSSKPARTSFHAGCSASPAPAVAGEATGDAADSAAGATGVAAVGAEDAEDAEGLEMAEAPETGESWSKTGER